MKEIDGAQAFESSFCDLGSCRIDDLIVDLCTDLCHRIDENIWRIVLERFARFLDALCRCDGVPEHGPEILHAGDLKLKGPP